MSGPRDEWQWITVPPRVRRLLHWVGAGIVVSGGLALVQRPGPALAVERLLMWVFFLVLAGFWVRQHGRSWVSFRAGQLRGVARRWRR